MKKYYILSCAGALLLAGCGNDEAENTGNEETNTEENNAEAEENNDESPEQDEEAVEVLEEAVATLEGMDSVYREAAVDYSDDSSMVEKQSIFIEDGYIYIHSVQEGGEAEEPLHTFTDVDDPDYSIIYREGDDEAVRYETPAPPTEDTLWFRMEAGQYETMLEEADLYYEGEEEINDYSTHALEVGGETTENRWFDGENYMQVRLDMDEDMEVEIEGENASDEVYTDLSEEVLDYEINPEFDESLFEVPDDMELTEGTEEDMVEVIDQD
ncbi:MAG: hypothetical protein EA344_09875 [Alkalicoccus sp.]|nr:MAG: hypothetical protein EA344_09875 [Alkalicoccus sp.]